MSKRVKTRVVSILSAACMLFAMSGCGESSQADTGAANTESSSVSEAETGSSLETTTAAADTSSETATETTTTTVADSSSEAATDSQGSDKAKKNSQGLYEYLVAGRYTIACKTNIYDYIFSFGNTDNFINLTQMSKDIGFEQAARLTTGEVDPNMAVAFRYYENGEKKFGIGFDHPNSEYREGMFTEDYDKNRGTGSGYTIHFKNDNHSNNYWTGSPDLKGKNVLRTSLSFDQIVLIVKGMEEAAAGNESDDWIKAAGITKPKGYSHYYIYY